MSGHAGHAENFEDLQVVWPAALCMHPNKLVHLLAGCCCSQAGSDPMQAPGIASVNDLCYGCMSNRHYNNNSLQVFQPTARYLLGMSQPRSEPNLNSPRTY